ncbi:probable receptor-like protein kinase At2g23200 [Alnus glutinosa]|uniref:probable receptor-like protein kinase At2g23200 n=1 Tax=Alnus glutinosa TaxID=3517 RepID=UPI002D7A0F3A|nr:probable receptor-like protein kinase At2g23200 [Alnus glutinosa]
MIVAYFIPLSVSDTQTPPEKVATLTKNSMEKLHSCKLQLDLQLCLLLPLHFSSLLLLSSAYTVPDKYFINCGASHNITSADGWRVFVGDRDFSAGKGKAVKSSNSSTDTQYQNLYQTARVYEKTSSYEFDISENGTYIVRLHFLHFFVLSSSLDLSVALFDVWASGFSLLTNYSIRNITTSPRIEEFFLTIPKGKFKIYFIPSQESSLAFVNAIEVFPAPDDFFLNETTRITSTGDNVTYSGLISQALHTIHRINVGGDYINGTDDLWRNWVPDDNYLLRSVTASNTYYSSTPNYQTGSRVTKYFAPYLVYQTAKHLNANDSSNSSISNATWSFPVNNNATHFVRVHFCDIVSTTRNDLWFNLYINRNYSKMIWPYDIIPNQLAAPFCLDFVVDSDDSGFMNVSIGVLEDSTIRDAFLNGLEILEFMEKSSSIPMESESKRKKFSPVIIGLISSGAFVILVVVVATGLKCRKQEPDQSLELLYGGFNSNNRLTESSLASLAPNLNFSLRISFAEIRRATGYFNAKHLIGKGGFGKVYKGTLRGVTVAVKRSEAGHGQGLHEFQTEIMVLSQIRYRHLVSLIGYCDEESEMILVYEFMEKGTLRDHLYHTDDTSEKSSSLSELSWMQRLEICVGAANGLDYLHTQAGRIIHRDVKSTNILLDKDYVAKVADFGLSKSGPPDPDNYTTNVKGSFGYLDPEYFSTLQLTEKSDVYSFGVVLFEVLCARPPNDNSLPTEEGCLIEWAMQLHREGQLEKIIDPMLVGKIKPGSLRKFSETAEKCLKQNSVERPSMREVVYDLIYAQQLQEPVMHRDQHEVSTTNITSLEGFQFPAAWNFPLQEDDEAPIVGDDDSDTADY